MGEHGCVRATDCHKAAEDNLPESVALASHTGRCRLLMVDQRDRQQGHRGKEKGAHYVVWWWTEHRGLSSETTV